jgi:hypothetical protein
VRHARIGGLAHAHDLAGQQAEAGDLALLRGFVQQLHAEADAEQGHGKAAQRLDESLRRQAGHRRSRGADAGQDHALGIVEIGSLARDRWRNPEALERVADRAQVRATGIDDDHAHHGNSITARPWCSAAYRLHAAAPAATRARRP